MVAGQIGWDAQAVLVKPTSPDEDAFVCQFAQALRNVAQVVQTAGGRVQDVISLRLYVTDKGATSRTARRSVRPIARSLADTTRRWPCCRSPIC